MRSVANFILFWEAFLDAPTFGVSQAPFLESLCCLVIVQLLCQSVQMNQKD